MTTQRKRRILRSLIVDEVSGVDRAAQAPAQALLRKRAPGEPEAIKKYERPMLTTLVDGHQHILDDQGQGGDTSWARSEGDEYGHSHPWVRTLDGNLTIGASEGHTHDLIPTTTILKTADGGKETPMTTPTTPITPAANPELEAIQKSVRDLTTRAERAEAIAKLNADERGLFDGLGDPAKTEFLAKSAAERSAMITASKDANRVVFKSASGAEYRTSDDPRLVEMAKRADASEAATKEALAKAENTRLEKRADEVIKHLPGTLPQRVAILKALEGVDGADAFLTAADAALAKTFKPTGTTGAASGASGDPLLKAEDRLEVLAKAYVTANPTVKIEKARVLVLESAEGQKLYAEMDGARDGSSASV